MRFRPSVLAQRRRGGAAVPPGPSSHPLAATVSGGATVSADLTALTASGFSWLQNVPAGYEPLRDTLTFPTGTDGVEVSSANLNTGWVYDARFNDITYQTDATKPFQVELGTGTGQWNYVSGMGAGNNDPAVIGPSGSFALPRCYAAYLIKHQAGFVPQEPGVKMSHFFFNNGNNIHLDSYHPTPAFTEAYGGVAGEWAPAPTGFSGGVNAPPFWRNTDFEVDQGVFNNVNRSAALVARDGSWQMIELFFDLPNGICRQWVDGVLTAEWTSIVYPSTTINLPVDSAGTFGGGSVTLSASQWWRMGGCAIYIPE